MNGKDSELQIERIKQLLKNTECKVEVHPGEFDSVNLELHVGELSFPYGWPASRLKTISDKELLREIEIATQGHLKI